MNTLPKDVEKRFDEKFPYRGAIIEDDGSHYTFWDIKQFLAEELEKAKKDEAIRIFKESGGAYIDWNDSKVVKG